MLATAAARASAREISVFVCVIEDSDMTNTNASEQSSDELPAAETRYATSQEEAERRSQKYRDLDPFPDIPRALLSSEHIKAYVRETGMIFPFNDAPDRLKSASYEVSAGGQFIYWDEDGKKFVIPVRKDSTFTLKRNSISFVQIESQFRLPQYIAVRFNLRITHVHRGLLLGTGPLVDPGFHGNLLVPLHNLTSDDYTIRGEEGLIWMEFTKTSHQTKNAPLRDAPENAFNQTEPRKNDQPPEYYFDRASKNRPIRSSMPVLVADARKLAEDASSAAARAERTNRIFVGAGLLAVVGTVVGLFSLFGTVNTNVTAVHNLIATVSTNATQAATDAKRAQDDVKDLKTQVEAADTRRSVDEFQRIRTQLEEARAQLAVLNAEVRRLAEEIRTRP
jgi:deoxycytidine triphosphate deaminase